MPITVVSYNSGRGLTCRAEVTPGTPPSIMLGQNTHPSRTSQNMNARKAMMIIRHRMIVNAIAAAFTSVLILAGVCLANIMAHA